MTKSGLTVEIVGLDELEKLVERMEAAAARVERALEENPVLRARENKFLSPSEFDKMTQQTSKFIAENYIEKLIHTGFTFTDASGLVVTCNACGGHLSSDDETREAHLEECLPSKQGKVYKP